VIGCTRSPVMYATRLPLKCAPGWPQKAVGSTSKKFRATNPPSSVYGRGFVLLEHCSFDIVHCSSTFDHSFDPVRGIREMLRVAEAGDVMFLRHCRVRPLGAQIRSQCGANIHRKISLD